MANLETTKITVNHLLTPDPVATAFKMTVASVKCENCVHHSNFDDFDDGLLWCHGWRQEVNPTDFCSFFKPLKTNTEKEN